MVIVCDTREQKPFEFDKYKTIIKKLDVGDYSLEGYEDKITIERKELGDLIACCGRERDRFEREIEKLKHFDYRCIICEGSYSSIALKQYRGQMHPNSIMGSIRSWYMRGVTVLMMKSRAAAQEETIKQLELAYRHFTRRTKSEDKSKSPSHPSSDPSE